jgi:hypothetical protein
VSWQRLQKKCEKEREKLSYISSVDSVAKRNCYRQAKKDLTVGRRSVRLLIQPAEMSQRTSEKTGSKIRLYGLNYVSVAKAAEEN